MNNSADTIASPQSPLAEGDYPILGTDIVSFSQMNDKAQIASVKLLYNWISKALKRHDVSSDITRWSPAGDGGYLTFVDRHYCSQSIDVAFSIAEQAKRYREWLGSGEQIQVKFALHYGGVTEAMDFAKSTNIWGRGINQTSRILDQASPGQILVSSRFHEEFIKEKSAGRNELIEFGEPFTRRVKHDENLEIRNAVLGRVGVPTEDSHVMKWQPIRRVWDTAVGTYVKLLHDAQRSGDQLPALAACRFLMNLGEIDLVRKFCGELTSGTQKLHWLFNAMSPEILLKVLEVAVPRRESKDATIFKLGEEADKCFFPISGMVEVNFPEGEPKRQKIGDILGEFFLWIPNIRRTGTAIAKTDVLLLEFNGKRLHEILGPSSDALESIFKEVQKRIITMTFDSENLFPKKINLEAVRAKCKKYKANEKLDLTKHVYFLFHGKVRLDKPTKLDGPVDLPPSLGEFGKLRVIGIRTRRGEIIDGSSATVLEEAVLVQVATKAIDRLLQSETEFALKWGGIFGQRDVELGFASAEPHPSPRKGREKKLLRENQRR